MASHGPPPERSAFPWAHASDNTHGMAALMLQSDALDNLDLAFRSHLL
jgi:hypothetical protein